MTDETAAQEPTMEEILASIRRIISEDDAPAETPPAAPAPAPVVEPVFDAAPEPEPAPAPEPVVAEVEEEVLELTEPYEAPAETVIGDLDVTFASEPEPEPFPVASLEPEPEPVAPAPVVADAALVGAGAAASAASAFAGLNAVLKKPDPLETVGGGVGPTIDEVVRSLLRPLLKDWLDANLPGIVQEAVRKEVERIARNAG